MSGSRVPESPKYQAPPPSAPQPPHCWILSHSPLHLAEPLLTGRFPPPAPISTHTTYTLMPPSLHSALPKPKGHPQAPSTRRSTISHFHTHTSFRACSHIHTHTQSLSLLLVPGPLNAIMTFTTCRLRIVAQAYGVSQEAASLAALCTSPLRSGWACAAPVQLAAGRTTAPRIHWPTETVVTWSSKPFSFQLCMGPK